MTKSILDGAKPLGWRFPDDSRLYELKSGEWYARDTDGIAIGEDDTGDRITYQKFPTAEQAAAALAAIGQGPASVKGEALTSPTPLHDATGLELRRLREAAKLSLMQAAKQLGVSPSRLGEIEHDLGRPTTEQFAKLAEIYGIVPPERETK